MLLSNSSCTRTTAERNRRHSQIVATASNRNRVNSVQLVISYRTISFSFNSLMSSSMSFDVRKSLKEPECSPIVGELSLTAWITNCLKLKALSNRAPAALEFHLKLKQANEHDHSARRTDRWSCSRTHVANRHCTQIDTTLELQWCVGTFSLTWGLANCLWTCLFGQWI